VARSAKRRERRVREIEERKRETAGDLDLLDLQI